MAADDRYLVGPLLIIGLCKQEPRAVQWAASVREADCVLSRLAIAIVTSVINREANETTKEEWRQALAALVSRMEAKGAMLVDVNETILARFHVYRLHRPLQFTNRKKKLEPVEQDVRLLITTADAMELVYAEYDDVYLQQLQAATRVRVKAL